MGRWESMISEGIKKKTMRVQVFIFKVISRGQVFTFKLDWWANDVPLSVGKSRGVE